jgi:hypothetical protein
MIIVIVIFQLEAIQIIRYTFSRILKTPPPHVTCLSTFISEITNKNCHVTFLLAPLPPSSVTYYLNGPLVWSNKFEKLQTCLVFLDQSTP